MVYINIQEGNRVGGQVIILKDQMLATPFGSKETGQIPGKYFFWGFRNIFPAKTIIIFLDPSI